MSDPTEPVDLAGLLDKPMGEFLDLPDLPAKKTFYGKITGVYADRSSRKETPLYRFTAKLTDPGADVPAKVIEDLKKQGFTLSDYEASANFYLTPNAMKILRRFLETLGFSPAVSIRANMKIDTDGNPTAETQDVFRDRDVIIRTPEAADNGKVYLQNVDSMAGVVPKKEETPA
jgi:hypothetical protein